MRVPGRETVPNCLLADLLLGHRRNDLVVHQQSVDVECLCTRRVGGLELNSLTSLRVVDSGLQGGLEQLCFVFELLHVGLSMAMGAWWLRKLSLCLRRNRAFCCRTAHYPRARLRP